MTSSHRSAPAGWTMVPMADQPRGPIVRICFVCTGNICRSPMAEAIFRDLVRQAGLSDEISISSAGTGEWHVGEKADPRTLTALTRAGYTADGHRARRFEPGDFADYDLIITFDRGQRRILRSWATTPEDRAIIRPLHSFTPGASPDGEVLDPYYGSDELFDRVRDEIEHACRAVLRQVEPVVRAARGARHDA